jgi:hypothetical protein
MNYIAFRDGRIIDPVILANIRYAASRGLVTESGKDLRLVPDTRYGKPDIAGLRSMRSVQKRDCI